MDTWIIAENETVGEQLRDVLQKFGWECPRANIVRLESVVLQTERCSELSGIVLVACTEVNSYVFEVIRLLRSVTRPETMIALVCPNAGREIILDAVRLGCNDFLRLDGSVEKEISEFLVRAQSQWKHTESPSRLLVFLPCQSVRDTHVLAVNVAAVIASHKGSCGILDFHFQGSDLSFLLKLAPIHTVTDLLSQPDKIDHSMFAQAISRHEQGIALLAGPTACSRVQDYELLECQRIVSLAQQSWQDVIINIENVDFAERTQVITSGADFILAIRPDVSSLHRANCQLEYLLARDVKLEQIHIAVVGTGFTGELPLTAIKRVLKTNQVHAIPDDEEAILLSTNIGNPLVAELPKSKAAVAIKRFVETSLKYDFKPRAVADQRTGSRLKAAGLLAISTLQLCR